jgi:deazaflavin-dependent oxidoreductase (nitroreductase family)
MTKDEKFAYVTTTGRKTGLPREIEIWFVESDGRIFILAEHGLKAHWVQNILANPAVHIRIGDRKWKAAGRLLDKQADAGLYISAQEMARQKYGWGDGLPVEFRLAEEPDFTGVWELNVARSIMRGPPPTRTLITIEHRETTVIQQVRATGAAGVDQEIRFSYEIGGETTNERNGATVRTRTWWDGPELVIESRMKTADREFYFKDHWSLSGDGRTLTMAHRDDDLAGQLSVLERIPASAL